MKCKPRARSLILINKKSVKSPSWDRENSQMRIQDYGNLYKPTKSVVSANWRQNGAWMKLQ
jgi:hypothetical protein